MKNFLLIIIVLSALAVHAQNVGVGTNNPKAKLDITASDAGILIPRIALSSTDVAAPVTAPETSTMIYNTATAGTPPNNVVPGFYYWNGIKWIPLGGTEGFDWKLTGNQNISEPAVPAAYGTSAIGSSENWLGTTDSKPVTLGTNNIERMRILSGGNIGIGTSTPVGKLEINGASAINTDIAFRVNNSNGPGIDNTFFVIENDGAIQIGTPPLIALSANNIGKSAITIGDQNVAQSNGGNQGGLNQAAISIGRRTQVYHTGGSSASVAIGESNILGTTSAYINNAYALGSHLRSTQSNTMVLGFAPTSGFTNSTANSIMITNNSTIPSVTVIQGNGNTGFGNVGIGTIVPQKKLEIVDSVNTGHIFPGNGLLRLRNRENTTCVNSENIWDFRIGNCGQMGITTYQQNSIPNLNILKASANQNTESDGAVASFSMTAPTGSFVLNTRGDIGINNFSPLHKVHILETGNSADTVALRVDESNIGNAVHIVEAGNGSALIIESFDNGVAINSDSKGAVTSSHFGHILSNSVTSSTASIAKTGLFIQSTGAWSGTNAVNTGLSVNVSGGTTNYSALFSGGNVGIGTATPFALLDVNGNARVNNNLRIGSSAPVTADGSVSLYGSGTGWQGYIHLFNNTTGTTGTDGGVLGMIGNQLNITNHENDAIRFSTNNTYRLAVSSDGHLMPAATNTFDIGSASERFKDAYFAGQIFGNITGSVTGNATTATSLQIARTINGTSFNGTANITTANWGTARTITIGATGKSVNGSANVSWTLTEIGAAAAAHTHSAADITSGTLPVERGGTGAATFTSGRILTGNATGAIQSTLQYTTTNTANALVQRDANGDTYVRYGFASFLNMSHGQTIRNTDNIFYSSNDNYIRKNTAAGFKTSLGLGSMADQNANAVNINGGTISNTAIKVNFRLITGATALDATDCYVHVGGGGDYTVTLPNAATAGAGAMLIFRTQYGSGTKTFASSSGDQIRWLGTPTPGAAYNIVGPAHYGLTFVSDGAVWNLISFQ